MIIDATLDKMNMFSALMGPTVYGTLGNNQTLVEL